MNRIMKMKFELSDLFLKLTLLGHVDFSSFTCFKLFTIIDYSSPHLDNVILSKWVDCSRYAVHITSCSYLELFN